MRILFTGGGTGGHFFPIVALIREIKRISSEERILDLQLFYMGPHDSFDKTLLADERVVYFRVLSGKLRRYTSFKNVVDMFKVALGVMQAFWTVFLIMPDVIFSKGGYGAIPAVVAAIIFRIPLVVHESDTVPGRVNKFSGRFAKKIGIAFEEAAQYFPKEKTALVGIPIRKRILGGRPEQGRELFSLSSQKPVVGIIGASQGAQQINDVVLAILGELTDTYEIIHQTGPKNFEDVAGQAAVILREEQMKSYHPVAFLDARSMRAFYGVCDIIVSRSGATSIYELAAWGKPSILVPLGNAAQNHQQKNAYAYAASGATVVIEEENLTPHILFAEIEKLFADPEQQKRMVSAAQRFALIDASALISKEILRLGLHR